MSEPRVLIVDDEADIRELLEITLGRMQLTTFAAADLAEARGILSREPIQFCLTDMNLPDGSGIDLVRFIQQEYPQLPVAMLTAYGSMDTAIEALKAGAFDFVSKPVELQRLRDLVQTALKLGLESEQRAGTHQLLGESTPIALLRKQVKKLARSQAPVYISGESGTGKELVARLIHEQGPRSDHPFVPVNCGAIPSELVESEFFGHRKGSFTGASSDKPGLFQAAHGGTLFLDEVADLPIAMQVKLLRALQEKSVRPVGAEQEVAVDVRILSATHKDLAQLVHRGEFRQDLFYRINVIELQVPPLRDRGEDILILANHLLDKLAQEYELPAARLSRDAQQQLMAYPFPGNVRELENILERAFTLCEEDLIRAADLHLPSQGHGTSVHGGATESLGIAEVDSLEEYLEEIEKKAIVQALERTKWNRTAAAKLLGMTFRQLRYRLKKLGID